MRRTLALLAAVTILAAAAVELPAASKAEIERLLDRLAASGCTFNRNGNWYDAQKARSHLAAKLAYGIEKKLVGSTEQFIAEAATRSSMTGQPYLVQCKGAPPMPSAQWLEGELRTLRKPAP